MITDEDFATFWNKQYNFPTSLKVQLEDNGRQTSQNFLTNQYFCRWGVYQYDPEEEHPRPEYLVQLEKVDTKTINFVTKTTEPKPPFWMMKVPRFLLSWTILAVLVGIAVISVLSVILYRYYINEVLEFN